MNDSFNINTKLRRGLPQYRHERADMLIIVLLIVACAIVVALYQKQTNGVCQSRRRLDGRTAIVTGGTSGMGLHIAEELARRGARVIVACPFPAEGAAGLAHVRSRSGNDDVVFKLLDLGSLESVRAFATHVLATEQRLDILVNNAGVGVPGDFLTRDGLSFIMQVNYFGTFQLTLLLLPLLIKSGSPEDPSRIVNTSSIAHWIGTADMKRLTGAGHYWPTVRVYANSKLCLVLFTHELAKRLRGTSVVVNCVDPGAVGTRIFESLNKLVGIVLNVAVQCLFKTARQGAQTALHVALDEAAGRVSGQLFKNCAVSRGVARAYRDDAALQLWDESARLVHLTPAHIEKCFLSS
ncbi:retinol dehydrogenase 12-like [Bombyx mandarina]|uniref:Retinol dehydrogenase 12-like n=1 Tax=Bombyx mandarina TaxID=7092 RepID=A0A6J2KK32_BOMMA|nr:retinol dehydrogenase 12-like [Bombyx mandarina]